MDATIKPLSDKVSMFATDKELYEQLTAKELMLIKLVKVEEYVDDLYRAHDSDTNKKLFPPEKSWFKIKDLLRECRKINKNKINT
jgi:hypothetical protein